MKHILSILAFSLVFSIAHAETDAFEACKALHNKIENGLTDGDESKMPTQAEYDQGMQQCSVALVGSDKLEDVKDKYKGMTKAARDVVAASKELCPPKANQGSPLLVGVCYRNFIKALYLEF